MKTFEPNLIKKTKSQSPNLNRNGFPHLGPNAEFKLANNFKINAGDDGNLHQ